MRAGQYKGWLPTLFVGQLLQGQTVGIVGAGRIGAAYARMVRTCAVCAVLRCFIVGATAERESLSARAQPVWRVTSPDARF